MHTKYLYVIFLYILLYEVVCDEEMVENNNENLLAENDEVFVATTEWQVVKKGQQLPKGLHVRVNFETGITEAKLLDENSAPMEENTKQNVALTAVPQEEYDEIDKLLLEKPVLKEAMKNIKNDEILKADDIKRIKEKFRTYEELKNELNDINLTPKIDAEVLKVLFAQYKTKMDKTDFNVYEIISIIEDLDFLAHQFDNGIEFTRQNGFNHIIYRNLNQTNADIKRATLKLFGSLVQNNAKVQIHALETGSISVLLRILSLDSENTVKTNAVTALSCLLRRFPLAQLKFIENGGLTIIGALFQMDSIKIQVKLTTLISDLLIEAENAYKDTSDETIRQYKLVNLENLLLEHNWCENLNQLLITLIATDPNDHDSIEKALISMHSMRKKCGSVYNKSVLNGLEQKYKQFAKNEEKKTNEYDTSEYFMNINELCVEILKFTRNRTEL